MPSQQPWERALERYADSLYRFALLRDPISARAARATVAAFEHIDWTSATLDDRFEAHLVAALSPPTRRISDWIRPVRRWPLPLPLVFWKLLPAARLALGMRLGRGFSTASIAIALNQPLDDVRLMLCDAIARLAGDDPATIDATCRHSRALRLDEPGLERMHVLGCDACRIALPRWEAAEQALANGISRAASTISLPREIAEEISVRLRAATAPTSTPTHSPLALRTASIVLAVLVVIGLLIVPRNHKQALTQPGLTARTVIQQALEQYGAPPAGSGVLHQRITLILDEPHTSYEADVWTDAAQPGRHRMQLVSGNAVQEWQSGDGARAWRYFTQPGERSCGVPSAVLATTIGRISRWSIPGDEQAMLRAARWQTGPWTTGRLLMEQALAAPTVRSLGTVTTGEDTILTLAAEGGIIDGTMLLRLDAVTSELREIRQLTASNGQTQAKTRWKLVSQERISSDAAMRAAIFTTYPTKQPPRELNRPGTILDPACPLISQENTASVLKVIGSGWPQLVGLPELPADMQRAYLAVPRQRTGSDGPGTYDPKTTALVYFGTGKRLVLRPRPLFLQIDDVGARLPGDGTIAGEWRVQLNTQDMGRFTGTASQLEMPSSTGIVLHQWDFFSEGLTHQQLVTLLGNVQILRLQDWFNQPTAYFDPEPLEPEVLEIVASTIQALAPEADRTDHFVIEREVRQEPNLSALEDPYHQLPPGGRSESWVEYGDDGDWSHFRYETRQPNGQRIGIEWGDSRHTQFYDVRANVVRDNAAMNLGGVSSIWAVYEALRPLFQHDGFKVIARDDATATIAATLPISDTEYQWALQVRQPPLPYWANWSSFDGAIPQSVTFSLKFDTVTGLIDELAVTIPGPNGAIMIQRTTIVTAEIGADPPREGWQYVPPAGTARIPADQAGNHVSQSVGGLIATTRLRDVIGIFPVQIWGWPPGSPIHFRDAYMPSEAQFSPPGFGMLELAVPSGFAIELHYYLERDDPINLLQGPAYLLRLMLQQTPPAWTTSERRILPIAGRRRPIWVMSAEGRHWAIVQLDQTLIVVDYRGEQFEEIVLPVLAHLEPIE